MTERFLIICRDCQSENVAIDVTYGTGSQTVGETYVDLRCRECGACERIVGS